MTEREGSEGTDARAFEARWHARWKEARAHEPDPRPGTPKFFATYPYSYMNSFAHVGHAFTMSRVDFAVRYHRMKGEQALFPFAYHVTGTPIEAAANRVREGEAKQIQILAQQGIPADEIPKFADPVHWVRFFPKEWRLDVERLGLAIDWRREFHTTDLNPHYDAFIRWQFAKLRERGFVEKGRHPVIWCPKDEAPVADHDRYAGEGETPQEWVLYRMRVAASDRDPVVAAVEAAGVRPGDRAIAFVAATLRPDTVFGQTNVWIDADAAYKAAVVRVGDREEVWLLNAESARDLALQFEFLELSPAGVPGAGLLGKRVVAAGTGSPVPVLPGRFVRHGKGTGIVTSVPSDSPQDLLSLRALQEAAFPAAGPWQDAARAIEVVPVIRTARYGEESAARAVAEAGAASDVDADRIAAATEKAYQAGFYEGVMLGNAGPFSGKPVAEAKDAIKAWLVERDEAVVAFWPSGEVVCRCLTKATVRIVSDQWFIKYGDAAWKAQARAVLDAMRLYPEAARRQFEYVIGWLRDWACAREAGLGTRLPWDDKWIIESLSDSTIYMAYYTIAHLVERGTVTGAAGPRPGVDPGDLTPAFFDHVLLGKGSAAEAARGTVTREVVEACRESFLYWYPLDFRNSGKDLVQNHLTFLLFNHVAVWDDPGLWPRGIGVNGWVTVDGEKMSKSRGNFITLRDALDAFGASGTRLALAYAGEGLDDANFDRDFAAQSERRMRQWLDLVRAPPKPRADRKPVDEWFLATLHRLVGEAGASMEETMFRTALKVGYFDLQREWAWYLRRCGGVPNAEVLHEFLDVQNRILTPFVPAVAEEARALLGGEGFAIDQPYPTPRPDALKPEAEEAERFVRGVLEDAKEILKVTGIAPKRIVLYTAPAWKASMHARALDLARSGSLNVGALIKSAMEDPEVKRNAKEAPKLAGDLAKSLSTLGKEELAARALRFDEAKVLEESAAFLASELGAGVVEVHAADAPGVPDPAGKARHAAPRRPAIYVEG